jgi:hypothetical protein
MRVVEGVKDLDRLISQKLAKSLERRFFFSIEELEQVSCWDCDPVSILVGLIQGLSHSSVVIEKEASVLHQLNSSLLNH